MHTPIRCITALFVLTAAACGDNLTVPPEREAAVGTEPEALSCLPNLDGSIASNELAAAIGIPIRYLVSPPDVQRTVDLAGSSADAGQRAWDFSVDFADDQELVIVPKTTEGAWYAGSFAPDAFVAPFDVGGRIETISRLDDDGLWLLGLASSEADPPEGRTLMVYQEPVLLLPLPVEVGRSLVSTGELSDATFRGLPYAGRDIYEVSVEAMGSLELPDLVFEQVHKVRTRVTVEPAVGTSESRIQVSYYGECFAEVARAVSLSGETDDDFTTAAELRRIGFP